MQNFKEIRSYLKPDITSQYSELENILARGNTVLNFIEQNQDKNSDVWKNTTDKQNETLKNISEQALAYIKNNEAVLTHISHKMRLQNPEQYTAFKNYLIAQDADFSPIFDKMDHQDAHIDIALEG